MRNSEKSLEIHAAVEREGIFSDNIDVGMVIEDALDTAFNAALSAHAYT